MLAGDLNLPKAVLNKIGVICTMVEIHCNVKFSIRHDAQDVFNLIAYARDSDHRIIQAHYRIFLKEADQDTHVFFKVMGVDLLGRQLAGIHSDRESSAGLGFAK